MIKTQTYTAEIRKMFNEIEKDQRDNALSEDRISWNITDTLEKIREGLKSGGELNADAERAIEDILLENWESLLNKTNPLYHSRLCERNYEQEVDVVRRIAEVYVQRKRIPEAINAYKNAQSMITYFVKKLSEEERVLQYLRSVKKREYIGNALEKIVNLEGARK